MFTPNPTLDTLLDMGAFLVRDNDRTEAYMARVSNLPKMAAQYQGQIEGRRDALSIIAGYLAFPGTDELIRHIRATRPKIAGERRSVTVHEAEGEAGRLMADQTARVMAADARQAWSDDVPSLEGIATGDVACGECGDWHARDDQRCPIANGSIERDRNAEAIAAGRDELRAEQAAAAAANHPVDFLEGE